MAGLLEQEPVGYTDKEYSEAYRKGLERDSVSVIPKPEWIGIDKDLPKSGEHVLAYCWVKWLSGGGKGYICTAYYAAPKSVLASEGWDDCATEYDEETDEYYLLPGWYEVIHNWDEYGSIAIEDFVTHWMPMPSEPRVNYPPLNR